MTYHDARDYEECIECVQAQIDKLKDKSTLSDGYHTFGELYEHRNTLFITLINVLHSIPDEGRLDAWKSLNHSDGSHYEGYFILGLNREHGQQITYHLPIKFWDDLPYFISTLDKAPEYDGHTSDDVLERLKDL